MKLTQATKDVTLSMPVRLAAARGVAMLNKYYSKTDESIMFRLAMSKSNQTDNHLLWLMQCPCGGPVLHPKYKTNYFVVHEWEAEWIAVAKQLLLEYWESYYKPEASAATKNASSSQVRVRHWRIAQPFSLWIVLRNTSTISSPTSITLGKRRQRTSSTPTCHHPSYPMSATLCCTGKASSPVAILSRKWPLTCCRHRHPLSMSNAPSRVAA